VEKRQLDFRPGVAQHRRDLRGQGLVFSAGERHQQPSSLAHDPVTSARQ
jgi:hypothetical protein